jgi:sporulation protein YlmC with PRC-barrel domain
MIRASDLLGCVVRTEAGSTLGRVHDLRVRHDGAEWLLVGLVVGRGGLIARLGNGGGKPRLPGRLVPWQSIVALADGAVTVGDDDQADP